MLKLREGMSLPEKVIAHITVSDAAMQKAAAIEKTAAAKQAQVNKMIPQVVDALVANERITPAQREKVAAMLADPVKALDLLIKTAAHKNAAEMAHLGSPVKQASANNTGYNSLTTPHVGARTTREKASSAALFRGLGIPVPTE